MIKVLIMTAWSPNKTRRFKEYSDGIVAQLKAPFPVELYITTQPADSKSQSIIRALSMAEEYAIYSECSHVLILDADMSLNEGALERAVGCNKSVLILNYHILETAKRLDYAAMEKEHYGWGKALIKTSVLSACPISQAYVGDFYAPDRAWFRRVLQNNIDVWLSPGPMVKHMDEPTNFSDAGGFFMEVKTKEKT
jgi:hypothetical protein